MRSFLLPRWGWAGLGLLLTLATFGASAATPKRVLILNPFGRDVAPFSTAVSSFRSTLARELGEPVDIYEVPLDLARLNGTDDEGPLVAFLQDRINFQPVDLVVPIGGAGVQFAARHREQLFPEIPFLLVAPDPRTVPPGFGQTNATLVTQRVNLPGLIEDILQLQPQTTNIVVVFGTSALERFWVRECRREFQSFTNRVGFTWLDDLSLGQVVDRCATLPPRSFILNPLFVVDADGVPCEKNEALRRLHATANAPLFGYFASEMGLGTMGGRLYQDTEVGAQGARTAIRILLGENPGNIPPHIIEAPMPVYDWRELQRWGISESRLPAGSRIQFRQPSFWELYRGWIIGTGLFFLLQAALIISLLINRASRLQGEAEATLIADISSKFVNLSSGEVDGEITAAMRRIGEFLSLDLLALWQWSPGPPGVFTLTHLYSAQPGLQSGAQMKEDDFPWFREQMLAGRTVAIASLKELPAAADHDREKTRQLGVKSNLTIPLALGGGPPIGILGLNTLRQERPWPDTLVKRLQLMAQIFTNALARKHADQALRESEERMTLAADAAEFGVWVWNIAGNEIWGSPRWLHLFGFESGERPAFDRVVQRIHPEHREEVIRQVKAAVAGGSDYVGEFCVVLPDGQERWLTSRGRMHTATNGEPARMLGAAIDTTHRRRGDEQVRQLSHAVEQSPVLILITDTRGRITYVNRTFTEVTGYALEEVIGQNPRLLKSGESPAALYQELWGTITSGRTWRGEFHNRKKNGDLYWESVAISPLLNAEGKVTHFVGVKEDITERKQMEAELLLERAELAHVARVSTMGELAASVAHELNQPLGAILANAEAAELFLQQDPPALDDLREILVDIRKDDERASQVIQRMRALLRKHELDRQPMELNSVVGDVFHLVSGDAALRGVSLAADLVPNLPQIAADRVHLQQVLLNLILNGMDAMAGHPRAQRQILVRTRLGAEGQLELSVTDSGPGIPPDKLAKLFEPFYTTKPNGMGMGLSISRTIVEAHHGRIWAENNESGGATFRISLPGAGGGGQVGK